MRCGPRAGTHTHTGTGTGTGTGIRIGIGIGIGTVGTRRVAPSPNRATRVNGPTSTILGVWPSAAVAGELMASCRGRAFGPAQALPSPQTTSTP
jgi:hypothetical protein